MNATPVPKYKFGDKIDGDTLIIGVHIKKKYVYYDVTYNGNGNVSDDYDNVGRSFEIIREDKL